MADADVTILAKLSIDGGNFAQGLEAASAQAKAFVENLNVGPGVTMPVGVNLERANQELYGFVEAWSQTPITFQVGVDLTRAEQQLADFAQRSGVPISVPGPAYGGGPAPAPAGGIGGEDYTAEELARMYPEYKSLYVGGTVSSNPNDYDEYDNYVGPSGRSASPPAVSAAGSSPAFNGGGQKPGSAALNALTQAAEQAAQSLIQMAQAAVRPPGGGSPGSPGGPPGGWGTFGSFNPATGQTVPIAFNPASREFFNIDNGMGMAGVDWPGFGNGGGRGNGSGGGGGGGGGGQPGVRGFHLGRMLGAFYLANEAHRIAGATSEYENESDLAGSDQQAQFRAADREVKSVEGGIFGLVAGEVVDPGGHRAAAAEDTAKAAEYAERRDDDLRAGVRHDRDLSVAAEAATATDIAGKRTAEQDARDNARDKALHEEDEKYRVAEGEAAKARDAAIAAAKQDREAVRNRGAALGGITFGLAAHKVGTMNDAAEAAEQSRIAEAEAEYRNATGIAFRQKQSARNSLGQRFDADDRRAHDMDAATDDAFNAKQDAERAGLTGDRVRSAEDGAKASESAEYKSVYASRGKAEADKWKSDIGDPTVQRAKDVAQADEDARHNEAAREAGDIGADRLAIATRASGDTDAADLFGVIHRAYDRSQAAKDRLAKAKASGNQRDIVDAQSVVDETDKDGAAQVEERKQELIRDRDRRNSESGDRVKDEEVAAEEDALRSKGRIYEADTKAFEHAQDNKVAKLREALKATVDAGDRANLEAEIKAAEAANPVARAARDAAKKRQEDRAMGDLDQQAREAADGVLGRGYDAERHRIQQEAEDYFQNEGKNDSQSVRDAHQRKFNAQQDAARDRDAQRYDRMRDSAAGILLRADGRDGEADALEIRRDVAEQERAIAPDDPQRDQKLADVKALGLARVAALQKSLQPKAQFGLSLDDYYRDLQEGAAAGHHTREALAAAAKLGSDIGTKQGNQLYSDGDMKDAIGHLGGAAQSLAAAAKNLGNTKQLYVVGG